MNSKFNTPILFLIFNRPETAMKVFEVIKKNRPSCLYIAADGPRLEKEGEKEICEKLRQNIINKIDWPCEVKTLFREKNLGCKIAVSSAIDWFFDNVEEGIILEDDCLPDDSFFYYCQELLDKYRNNFNIALISGDNFCNQKIGAASYYFVRVPHIWGWATWRRVWKKYDLNMLEYPNFKNDRLIKNIWTNKNMQNYWVDIFDKTYNNKIDTWDYQLTFSVFLNNCLCICPNVNLVSNIGFGKNFTNTLIFDKSLANLFLENINFPLSHPQEIIFSEEAENYVNKNIFLKKYTSKLFLRKIGAFNLVKNIYIELKKYFKI